MKILITGGAGYIGSHVVKKLLKTNHEIVVLDNLSRGHIEAIPSQVKLLKADLLDAEELMKIFLNNRFDAVIHFAAFMYVWESIENPILYYVNNSAGTINLLNAMIKYKTKYLVFSSTCSVYGEPKVVPISENSSLDPINPYGMSKLIVENILKDLSAAFDLKYISLRYFNAAGADADGEIGESHNPEPHLIPKVIYAAIGRDEYFNVFGDNYPTPDGTCIRDYIHVNDLADAHIKALDYLVEKNSSNVFNLGTGIGYSVKEILNRTEVITNRSIPLKVSGRRVGDPAILVADNKKAIEILGWHPVHSMDDIIRSAWDWFRNKKY